MHGRNADILQRGAGVVLRLGVHAVVLLGDDAALFELVEQEATVGGDVAIAFVFAQQFEAFTLQTTFLLSAADNRRSSLLLLGRGIAHLPEIRREVREGRRDDGCDDGGRCRDDFFAR